ncbi:MAG TPA: hypothetical protein VEQ60_11390, partial [Longimicrobium sp.]|nr:hypothetical protein [Longimicrobium sp.]
DGGGAVDVDHRVEAAGHPFVPCNLGHTERAEPRGSALLIFTRDHQTIAPRSITRKQAVAS